MDMWDTYLQALSIESFKIPEAKLSHPSLSLISNDLKSS